MVCSPANAENVPRRVLFLHSYNYTLPGTTLIAEGARKRLVEKSAESIEVDAVYLDAARYVEPEQETVMATFLRDRYAKRRPDVIVPIGPDALAFTVGHRDEFAPAVPVVFAAISRATYQSQNLPPDVTGHIIDLELLFDRTLALAENLQPDARRLYVIAGSALVDVRWQAIARKLIGERERQFDTTYLFGLAYPELIDEVSRIPPDAIVIYLNVLRDSAGKTFVSGELAAELSGLSAAPVYSPYAYPLKGPLGGFYEQTEAMGSTAADIVLEILAGKDPASIVPRTNPNLGYRVDFKAMERWGLSETNLPPGTVVLDKPPSLWELYRWYVVAAASLIALQAILIAGLLFQRRRRRLAEADIRLKESALRVSYEQVRELNGQLITAQEEERGRIARELHDDVGQRLASLSIGLSSLKRHAAAADRGIGDGLSQLQKEAVCLAKDLRDLSHELHPGVLQHVGLPAALRARCEEISAESRVEIGFDVADGWSETPDEISLCLYRVAQEALRNMVTHANAATGHVSLGRRNGHVEMQIADDGRGFDANGSASHKGLGLLSMRERVRMLGGSLDIRSSAGAGTVAVVSIPAGDAR